LNHAGRRAKTPAKAATLRRGCVLRRGYLPGSSFSATAAPRRCAFAGERLAHFNATWASWDPAWRDRRACGVWRSAGRPCEGGDTQSLYPAGSERIHPYLRFAAVPRGCRFCVHLAAGYLRAYDWTDARFALGFSAGRLFRTPARGRWARTRQARLTRRTRALQRRLAVERLRLPRRTTVLSACLVRLCHR